MALVLQPLLTGYGIQSHALHDLPSPPISSHQSDSVVTVLGIQTGSGTQAGADKTPSRGDSPCPPLALSHALLTPPQALLALIAA